MSTFYAPYRNDNGGIVREVRDDTRCVSEYRVDLMIIFDLHQNISVLVKQKKV